MFKQLSSTSKYTQSVYLNKRSNFPMIMLKTFL